MAGCKDFFAWLVLPGAAGSVPFLPHGGCGEI